MKSLLRSPAFPVTLAVFGIALASLIGKSSPPAGALYFVPSALGPLLVSLILAGIFRGRASQLVLLIGSLLYAAWFGFFFCEIFYWNPDPQSAIGLLFVGAYSLPVMIPVWVIALVLGLRNRGNSLPGETPDS